MERSRRYSGALLIPLIPAKTVAMATVGKREGGKCAALIRVRQGMKGLTDHFGGV